MCLAYVSQNVATEGQVICSLLSWNVHVLPSVCEHVGLV